MIMMSLIKMTPDKNLLAKQTRCVMNEGHFRGFRVNLFLEHVDSRDDVTSVLYFRFLKKNKNKVVSNRCNRCVDSIRDHTNNKMASQYFF